MFEYVGINLGLCWPQLGVAPILMAEELYSEEAALVFQDLNFGGPLRRDDGLCISLLLTNFSVAFGISSLRRVNQALIMKQKA